MRPPAPSADILAEAREMQDVHDAMTALFGASMQAAQQAKARRDQADQMDAERLLRDAHDQADARAAIDQRDRSDIAGLLAPSPFRSRTVNFIRGPDGLLSGAEVIEADGRRRYLRLVRDRQGELAGILPQQGQRFPKIP